MPSMFSGSAPGRGISRVNSLKRDWEEPPPEVIDLSSSQEIAWSSSPEVVKHKPAVKISSGDTAVEDDGLTPAQRRRRAILAALSTNTEPPPAPPSAPPLKSSGGATTSRPTASAPLPLPSLPSLSRPSKRPWEEDFTSRKVLSTTDSKAGPSTLKRAKTPELNIRQKILLSNEQTKVLQLVVHQGENVFFTGSAGTGKSVLLREIIVALKKKYAKANDAVAVTASTGIAACNIGGVTLHSFGGAGLATEPVDVLVRRIRKNKKAVPRWLRTKVLIIDEVSMVDADLFDKYDQIARVMRKKDVPFGGMQIVVTGDFFQLPPVTKGNSTTKFCFEAASWNSTVQRSINLSKVFRQRDASFVNMLNEMRFGKLTAESIQRFRALSRPVHYDDGIEPTELFPRREDVDRSNSARLAALNTEGFSYPSTDGGTMADAAQREKLLANFMAPKHMVLKVDAQVMLIKNIDETLVNGSMGKVMGFCYPHDFLLDSNGQWRKDAATSDGEDDDQARKLRAVLRQKVAKDAKPLPVVRFKVPGGVQDMLVEFEQFKSELPNGEVQVSRTQLPLILAWAMSIHKSQGQTLDRVKVDLGKVFEKGQAYVALSRATSLEGLEVRNFRPDKVMAHPKVAKWTQTLQVLD